MVEGQSHAQLVVLCVGTAYLEGNLAEAALKTPKTSTLGSCDSTSRKLS